MTTGTARLDLSTKRDGIPLWTRVSCFVKPGLVLAFRSLTLRAERASRRASSASTKWGMRQPALPTLAKLVQGTGHELSVGLLRT